LFARNWEVYGERRVTRNAAVKKDAEERGGTERKMEPRPGVPGEGEAKKAVTQRGL